MRPINKVLIHCSATPKGRDDKAKDIKEWHLAKGWSDVGYHFIIELDGKTVKGRPIELLGAHCRGYNKFSIGICYIGGMDENMDRPQDTRTDAQKKSLVKLVNKLKKQFPNISIHGHNEFSNKACPSFSVADEFTSK
tara:strand:+ start:2959 stop:3369 length:411 start_codon:yes stop_codon:yes gene_type:complete